MKLRWVNQACRNAVDALLPWHCCLCLLPSDQPCALCTCCEASLTLNNHHCDRCALPLPVPTTGSTKTLCDSMGASQSQPMHDSQLLCANCLQERSVFTGVVAPYVYDPAIAYLLRRWKYDRDRVAGRLLMTLWRDATGVLPPVDAVVALPLNWRRLLYRGFNQADSLRNALLCNQRTLATLPAPGFRLKRSHAAKPQVGQNAQQRRSNLRGAFTVSGRCDNLRIAVIDDVVTTGATANAAAAALFNAGAREVHIWCIARTPTPAHTTDV